MASGIALIDKRPGVTSFEALGEIKRAFGTKKIGHTGTLDSFASGLLVALVGDLTRFAPYITALPKTYRAEITFGAETDTLDPLGSVIRNAPLPRKEDFFAALERFTGTIQQKPPRYSALKIDGKRASDLTRAGKNVEMKPRTVTIYSLYAAKCNEQKIESGIESAEIFVSCSAGAYIRALARDIAEACGSAAYLASLRRLSVGCFSVEAAEIHPALIPMSPALASQCGLAPLTLNAAREKDFFNGAHIHADWFSQKPADSAETEQTHCAVFTSTGAFIGVVEFDVRAEKFLYGFVRCPP